MQFSKRSMELDARSERGTSRCGTAMPSPAGSMHSRRSRGQSRSRRAVQFPITDDLAACRNSGNSSMSVNSGLDLGRASPSKTFTEASTC